MDIIGVGKRVRIYVGESDHWRGQPLYLALLEKLRAAGTAGATAFRGIAGFGAHSRIHMATIVHLAEDLPIVIEWIDTPDRVERVLPKITAMVTQGMITVEETHVTHYQEHKVDDISNHLRVSEVMTRDVVRVRPELPLAEAVELLVDRDYRALPVVDAQDHVLGIVTNGDLVERGGLRVRVDLLGVLRAEQLARELAAVEDGMTVGNVMTSPVITVGPDTTLADAAHLMVARRLKRLPVVDSAGVLLGIVSRADLLRTRAEAFPVFRPEAPTRVGRTIGDVMRSDVPVVGRSAPLSTVLDAVISTRLCRALVVDEEHRVVDVITDAELLRRLSPEDHPGLLKVLMSRLPFVHLSPAEKQNLERVLGTAAEQLMDREIPTVPADMPLGEAIEVMLHGRRKLLPVVDAAGRLVGRPTGRTSCGRWSPSSTIWDCRDLVPLGRRDSLPVVVHPGQCYESGDALAPPRSLGTLPAPLPYLRSGRWPTVSGDRITGHPGTRRGSDNVSRDSRTESRILGGVRL